MTIRKKVAVLCATVISLGVGLPSLAWATDNEQAVDNQYDSAVFDRLARDPSYMPTKEELKVLSDPFKAPMYSELSREEKTIVASGKPVTLVADADTGKITSARYTTDAEIYQERVARERSVFSGCSGNNTCWHAK